MEPIQQPVPAKQPTSPKKILFLSIFGIVIAIISSLTTYSYSKTASLQATNEQAIRVSPTPVPSAFSTPTKNPDNVKESLGNKILQLYKDYDASQPYGLKGLFEKEYLTENSYTALQRPIGSDPVLCTQGGSESPVLIDAVFIHDPMAIVIAKQYYEGSKTYNYITFQIRLKDQKITAITCQDPS